MRQPVIIDYVRTPFGRYAGALSTVRPDDLAATVVGEAVRRAGIDPAAVDEVLLGDTNQAGEDNRNVARMASLLAGFPVEVPGGHGQPPVRLRAGGGQPGRARRALATRAT